MTVTVPLREAPRNHWIRLDDGTLIKFFDMRGTYGLCRNLREQPVNVDGNARVEVLNPLGYDADDNFD